MCKVCTFQLSVLCVLVPVLCETRRLGCETRQLGQRPQAERKSEKLHPSTLETCTVQEEASSSCTHHLVEDRGFTGVLLGEDVRSNGKSTNAQVYCPWSTVTQAVYTASLLCILTHATNAQVLPLIYMPCTQHKLDACYTRAFSASSIVISQSLISQYSMYSKHVCSIHQVCAVLWSTLLSSALFVIIGILHQSYINRHRLAVPARHCCSPVSHRALVLVCCCRCRASRLKMWWSSCEKNRCGQEGVPRLCTSMMSVTVPAPACKTCGNS